MLRLKLTSKGEIVCGNYVLMTLPVVEIFYLNWKILLLVRLIKERCAYLGISLVFSGLAPTASFYQHCPVSHCV